MRLIDLGKVEIVRATIILEAANQELYGKLLVGSVIGERKKDSRWPDTWAGVCLQPKQLSCWNKFDPEIPLTLDQIEKFVMTYQEKAWWRECQFAAWGIVNSYYGGLLGGANHYHREDIKPDWTELPNAKCVGHVGAHLFWKL